jgi:hypothetical protein
MLSTRCFSAAVGCVVLATLAKGFQINGLRMRLPSRGAVTSPSSRHEKNERCERSVMMAAAAGVEMGRQGMDEGVGQNDRDKALTVRGDEGLLDSARMEKAFKGTGIKVPPEDQLSVGVIGCGLAGMVTAMELADAGHKVEIFDSRRFHGGKAGSWVDKDANHIEMGLHVFFGCYYNLFGIMKRVGGNVYLA